MLEAKRSGLSAGAQLPAVTKAVLMPLCIQGLLPRVKKATVVYYSARLHLFILFSTFKFPKVPQPSTLYGKEAAVLSLFLKGR